ncbi:MAG: hypothetical protein ABL982_08620, partial [Vicinamibacterales bacterium]
MQHTAVIAKLASYIVPQGEVDLRELFYERLCLTGAAATLLVVLPINAIQRLPAVVSGSVLLLGVASLAFYVAARRGRYYPGAFLLAILLTLNVAWFPNAGTFGSVPLYWVIPIYYAVVFFSGRTRALVLAGVALNVLLLMTLEYARPELVVMFESSSNRYIDLATGFVVSTGIAMLMLWIVSSGYARERERLRVAVDALAETEERFVRLFQVNPDAVFVYDVEQR